VVKSVNVVISEPGYRSESEWPRVDFKTLLATVEGIEKLVTTVSSYEVMAEKENCY
jgi:hypothetical protein